MPEGCVLALDLGTTAFKAAPVNERAVLGPVTVVPYAVDHGPDGRVTCDPRLYVRCARRALRGAARSARAAGLQIRAIGLSSQAQTFLALGADGVPVAPAVVWTDASAVREADVAARALPDFRRTSGFARPSPLQFLPKVMRFHACGPDASRFLLLNEWVIRDLTGEHFGDAPSQGMGGFYDIVRQTWNDDALSLAGITPCHLATVAPAGGLSAPLARSAGRAVGLPPGVPVYSCGNDQSCAAIGAGLEDDRDLFANFGTALVVYALKSRPAESASDDQIAGVSPLSSSWFLLGLESEFGNVLEWLAGLLYPRGGVSAMLERALDAGAGTTDLPTVRLPGSGCIDVMGLRVGDPADVLPRALLEHYAARFGALLAGVVGDGPRPRRAFAGGGLSRSQAWLDFLSRRHGIALMPTCGEHPGLVGVARIIACGAAA